MPKNRTEAASAIITGDFLAVAERELAGRRFNLVLADPPYGIGKDFGNDSDRLPLADYLAWSRLWIAAAMRLLAPGGLAYIYGSPEVLARIAAEQPLDKQRLLVWAYTNKTAAQSRFWQRSHESILALWGGPKPRLQIDQIREPYSPRSPPNGRLYMPAATSRYQSPPGRAMAYSYHPAGALPRDVLSVPVLSGAAGKAQRRFLCRDCGGRLFGSGERIDHRGHKTVLHPTQKPLALSARLIRSVIGPDGGSVLVPFAGSGSECVAAQELGADFVGVELNPDYADLARAWLAASVPPPRLV